MRSVFFGVGMGGVVVSTKKLQERECSAIEILLFRLVLKVSLAMLVERV